MPTIWKSIETSSFTQQKIWIIEYATEDQILQIEYIYIVTWIALSINLLMMTLHKIVLGIIDIYSQS